jgi:two-component system, LuxR family, sensor kinase FixL
MTGPTNGGRARGYEALRESEELHRATIENISDAVFTCDDGGAFTYICPNVDVIFGYLPDEVQAMGTLGRLLGEGLFDPVDLTARGEIRNVEREIDAKSGQRRVVLIHLKRVSIQGGTVLCTCRDITERKQAEKELATTRLELAHAARLALVGEMTASIVHEIQQPLTSIQANASAGLHAVLGAFPPDGAIEELREIFKDIHAASGDAAAIVQRLRTLVRKRPLELSPIDVNGVASDVLALVAPDASRRRVTLHAELARSLPPIHADRVSLQQVLLNLVVNAMEALEEDGRDRQVVLRTRPATGAVECLVSDTGRGIAAAELSKVFDPFFSTKKDGIGLGLAIARTIVEAHSGRIWAEDHGGHGTTFRVTLPVPTQQAPTRP